MLPFIAVSYSSPDLQAKAAHLASALKLDLLENPHDPAAPYTYLLLVTPEYIGLQKPGAKKFAPFYIDFLAGKIRYRSAQAGLRKELLARAIGVKPGKNPYLLDATAGLGRDSFILATLGFHVTLLERSPILHCLLQDALRRAARDARAAAIIQRMTLIQADARDWLRAAPRKADVIYLDPMFPSRQKSAQVKKELQILQEIIGKDPDSDTLLTLALTCATTRVVVKRPRLASPLKGPDPAYSLTGSSSRFDIYLV